MKILAVEFSSEQRSAAVVEGDAANSIVCARAEETGGRSAHAFFLVEQALRAAKMEREAIECLAIGLGPGSYTGIRAAIALAQGWQLARGTKVLGISSVECLAAQAFEGGLRGMTNFIVDAQRNEFYLAAYTIHSSGVSVTEPLRLATFAEVEQRVTGQQRVVGPGATRSFPGAREFYPDAAMLGRLACKRNDFVGGENLEPIYLRETTFVKAPPARIIAT